MREIQSFIHSWEIALFMSIDLPLGLPASVTRHGVGAVNDVLNNAPSCVWHAHHFNPFTLLKHINWEKFNPLFFSFLWETIHKLRNHSAHTVTRLLWHVTLVTCDPCDMWPLWHVTPVTCDTRDIWPLWHVTLVTCDTRDMWHDASVTRHPHCDMWHDASVTRQIIMHLLPCSNHLDYILSRVTTSRDSCCHWSDKYVHHIRLYLKKSLLLQIYPLISTISDTSWSLYTLR